MFRSTTLLATAVAAAVTGVMLPGPAAATPQAAAPQSQAAAATPVEAEVVRLTNRARARHGCRAVRTDGRLTTAARRHSIDMARNNFFNHTGSDGSDFVVRARRAGYRHAMAENIAQGQRTAAEVVQAWMGSTGHRRIILNCSAKAVGVGVARDRDGSGTLLWTQVFGRA
jgi:uncharacterized protein YkwD